MAKRVIPVTGIHRETGAFNHGIGARGEQIYISGQIPLDPDGNLVGKGDIKAQAHQVFRNIGRILEGAGGSYHNLVKLTFYLTDINLMSQVAEVRKEYIPEPYPASTVVEVSKLLSPDWLLEVEAIAVID